jgi:LysR family transcriptional regulator, regulator for bpeEF and oprC
VARLVVIPHLREFFELYPDVQLEVGASDRPLDLINEGIDCVVRVGSARDPRVDELHLGHLEMCTCASPHYLELHGTPKRIEDLSQHFAVNYAASFHNEVQSWSYMDRGIFKSLLLRSRVTVNNVEAYIASAVAGLGLIQLPTYDVREFMAPGTLIEVMRQWRTQSMPIVLLYPKRRHQTQVLLVFIEWIQTVLRASLLKPL